MDDIIAQEEEDKIVAARKEEEKRNAEQEALYEVKRFLQPKNPPTNPTKKTKNPTARYSHTNTTHNFTSPKKVRPHPRNRHPPHNTLHNRPRFRPLLPNHNPRTLHRPPRRLPIQNIRGVKRIEAFRAQTREGEERGGGDVLEVVGGGEGEG